jgi:hypothetical protein
VEVAGSLLRSDKADNTKLIENQPILLGRPTIFPDFHFWDGIPLNLEVKMPADFMIIKYNIRLLANFAPELL